jgi:hypothetical protein
MRISAFSAGCLFALVAHAACGAELPFAVIAASDVPRKALARESLALIYLRRQQFWSNGLRAQPVNLPANEPLRRAFSHCVLGQTPEQTEDYWRERYFHGVLPPRVLGSEHAMRVFVASTPGAIAYVSRCSPIAGYIVLLTFGKVPDCPSHPATCVPLQN